mgnify:CR=1 FL=1
MNIAIVGTGYVGLVTGACLAEMGNLVICFDIDERKIQMLNKGEIPIYEPGLEELIKKNNRSGRLCFASDLEEAVREARIIFIAVGTPPDEAGDVNLSYVLNAATQIGKNITKDVFIATKSTVPVGTSEEVETVIQGELDKRGINTKFVVVSNPEFLKEGAAIDDFMKPDRIIIGTHSEKAKEIFRELYQPFSRTREKIIFMGVRDSEMTKYASNAMLATKISFMNEMAILCERYNVDVENVRNGMGSDPRIGFSFIFPGCGYGGSCFPKDVKAILEMARKVNFETYVFSATEKRNELQKQVLVRKITKVFGSDLSDKVFAIWGLSFKPGTDDVREAPSVVLIDELFSLNATVQAYDPVATQTMKNELVNLGVKGKITFANNQYEALDNSDALILLTEWNLFRQPDFKRMEKKMKYKVIFDGRNQYDPSKLSENGWSYFGIGR